MAQQWRISVKGKMRQDVNVDLLMQAVIALGHQLRDEQQKRDTGRKSETSTDMTTKGDGQ